MKPETTRAGGRDGSIGRRETGGRDGAAAWRVRAKVWLYDGAGGWHFANLSAVQSKQVRARSDGPRRGWGAVPVDVRIGRTEWKTSLFPDAKSGTYLFAIKADVRRREEIAAGDMVTAYVRMRGLP